MTEVIGTGSPVVTDTGHYFTLEEFRASDPSSFNEFSDLEIESARTWAEERFEHAAHCAWIERTFTASLIGGGSSLLELPHMDIRAVTGAAIDGEAIDTAPLVVVPYGFVRRPAGWPLDSVISITYTYGKTVIPEPVKEAIILLAQFKIVPKNLRQNALSEATDVGFIRLAHATPGGKTGLLEVDAVAVDYGHAQEHIG